MAIEETEQNALRSVRIAHQVKIVVINTFNKGKGKREDVKDN
jgi:hypothetical protein